MPFQFVEEILQREEEMSVSTGFIFCADLRQAMPIQWRMSLYRILPKLIPYLCP